MVWPSVRLHQLYSVNFYNDLDIMFEDLRLLDIDVLRSVATTKQMGHIQLVDKWLSVNTVDKTISIQGCKLNDSVYLINKEGNGVAVTVAYTCSNDDILTGIEYLYHMYKNLVPSVF
jgi:hypothetical protein